MVGATFFETSRRLEAALHKPLFSRSVSLGRVARRFQCKKEERTSPREQALNRPRRALRNEARASTVFAGKYQRHQGDSVPSPSSAFTGAQGSRSPLDLARNSRDTCVRGNSARALFSRAFQSRSVTQVRFPGVPPGQKGTRAGGGKCGVLGLAGRRKLRFYQRDCRSHRGCIVSIMYDRTVKYDTGHCGHPRRRLPLARMQPAECHVAVFPSPLPRFELFEGGILRALGRVAINL